MEEAENPLKSRHYIINSTNVMKYYIQTKSTAWGSFEKKEIPEPVYIAISTASADRAKEMVENILGESLLFKEWSLTFE